ncbi:MAG: hypothetical protein Q8T08_15855, partial [Ignavibacteria bacterium]|nr:hypothetical protein [Ignavibacteria bacterium]
ALQNTNFEKAQKVAFSLEHDFSNKPYYAYLVAKVLYLRVMPLGLTHIWMPFSKDKVALIEKAKYNSKKAYEGLGARADTEERYRDVYLTYLSILAISGDDFEVINVSRNLLRANPSIEYLSFLIYAILKKDGYEKAMEEIDLYVSKVDAHDIDILRIQVLQPCNDENQIQYYIDQYKINVDLMPWLIKRHINTDFIISDILKEALSSDDLDITCDCAFMLFHAGEKEMVRLALAHAISRAPDIVNTMRIALLYSNIGAEEEALEQYQKIFETGFNPNAAYAYLELLWKKQRIGVLSLALKKVDDSMMMDTNFARLKLQILFETNLDEGAREAELYLKKNIHDLWVRVQLCWYCFHYDRKKLKDFLSYNP